MNRIIRGALACVLVVGLTVVTVSPAVAAVGFGQLAESTHSLRASCTPMYNLNADCSTWDQVDGVYGVNYGCRQAAPYDLVTYEAGRWLPPSLGPVTYYGWGGPFHRRAETWISCQYVQVQRGGAGTGYAIHSCYATVETAGSGTTQSGWSVADEHCS